MYCPTTLEQERVINKFRIKHQSSLREKTTQKEATHSKKPTKLLFDDDLTGASSDKVSQKNLLGAEGRETLPDRDINDYDWAMQYIDSNKRVVLLTARNKGHDQLAKDCLFNYERLLRFRLRRPRLQHFNITCRLFEGGLKDVCFRRSVGERVVWA
mgnify:CR=1 FL=1